VKDELRILALPVLLVLTDCLLQAEEWKNKGNDALKAEKFQEAIDCYTKAISFDPQNHVLYSNRSAAYVKANDGENALKDADKTVEINPKWGRVRVTSDRPTDRLLASLTFSHLRATVVRELHCLY